MGNSIMDHVRRHAKAIAFHIDVSALKLKVEQDISHHFKEFVSSQSLPELEIALEIASESGDISLHKQLSTIKAWLRVHRARTLSLRSGPRLLHRMDGPSRRSGSLCSLPSALMWQR